MIISLMLLNLAGGDCVEDLRKLEKPAYRYLATRELLAKSDLPGMEIPQELPFLTMTMDSARYKIFGIVTNMDWDGRELVTWLYRRCGKSEEAQAVMKDDLAGGTLPSGRFGENAAWWWIMILALNLNSIMKRIILNCWQRDVSWTDSYA